MTSLQAVQLKAENKIQGAQGAPGSPGSLCRFSTLRAQDCLCASHLPMYERACVCLSVSLEPCGCVWIGWMYVCFLVKVWFSGLVCNFGSTLSCGERLCGVCDCVFPLAKGQQAGEQWSAENTQQRDNEGEKERVKDGEKDRARESAAG